MIKLADFYEQLSVDSGEMGKPVENISSSSEYILVTCMSLKKTWEILQR